MSVVVLYLVHMWLVLSEVLCLVHACGGAVLSTRGQFSWTCPSSQAGSEILVGVGAAEHCAHCVFPQPCQAVRSAHQARRPCRGPGPLDPQGLACRLQPGPCWTGRGPLGRCAEAGGAAVRARSQALSLLGSGTWGT